jgi:hypothetical protein
MATEERQQGLGLGNIIDGHRQVISIQHREIGEFARCDRAAIPCVV